MINKIEEIFHEITGHVNDKITEKTKIDKELGVSSLGLVQVVCALEDEFDIEIPNSAIKKLKTVGDVVKYLEANV